MLLQCKHAQAPAMPYIVTSWICATLGPRSSCAIVGPKGAISPGWHGEQKDDPEPDTIPGRHGEQLMAPGSCAEVPASQGMHELCWVRFWKEPGLHSCACPPLH